MKDTLILSIFPGVDLLGKGFEEQGACIVQAQDKILGGDIVNFNPPSARFDGVIGGSPCQDFSLLNRNPKNYSHKMLDEYQRVVCEASPDWFLFENVVAAPEFQISGYYQQRFMLDLAWFSDFSRRRVFVFGSKSKILLNPMYKKSSSSMGTAVVGSDERSYEACCQIQGLDEPIHLPFLTLASRKQVIANAVPLQISRYIARLINSAVYSQSIDVKDETEKRRCACGCGRITLGRAKTHNASCRKRLSRSSVTQPVS